jgi:CHAT domain-containing protein
VWLIGLVAATTLPARSAGGETPEQQVRGAEAHLDDLSDRFRRRGGRPAPEDVATVEGWLNQAVDAYAARGDWAQVARALILLGRAERMVSRFDPAIAYAERAAEAARRAHDGAREAKALMDRAKSELSRNDFGSAGLHAEAAVGLAARTGDVTLRFDTLDTLAQVDVAVGRTNAAAEMLARAFALRGLKDESLFFGHLDRGDVYVRIADRCEHEPVFEVCLPALDKARAEYRGASEIAHRLGWLSLERMAQEFIQHADLKGTAIKSRQHSATTYDRAKVFHPKKASDVFVIDHFAPHGDGPMPPAFEQYYKESKQNDVKAGGFARSSSSLSLFVDGIVQQWHGDNAAALGFFQKAIEVIEQDHRSLSDDADRAAIFGEYAEVYTAATLTLLDLRRTDEAFAMMERSRARAMADLLASRRLTVGGSAEQRLYAEGRRVDGELGARQATLFALQNGGGTPAQIAASEAEVARLEKARRALAAQAATQSPRLAGLSDAQTVSLAALQALAREERFEAIDYLTTETNVVIWYVGPSGVKVKNVFLPQAALRESVAALEQEVASEGGPFDHGRARELYLQLVQPVRAFVTGDRLLILPHDVLSTLPFEVLEDPADGVPLGARFEVAYAPSATIYAGLRRWSSGAPKRALVIADPGIEAEGREAARVAAAYRGASSATTRLEAAALPGKRKLAGMLPGFDVVHMSVHGKFDGVEPLLSYVELAPEGSDDGRLTAAEMFGLPLSGAALVVLSACESGRVDTSNGNDVVGIVRGLVYAGAGGLLLSRWAVRAPPTALWMETFHRKAQGQGLAAAARSAREAVRADPKYQHPYYWAAFSVIGRAS